MEILILLAVFGLVVGVIASSKGRAFLPWFIYGAVLFLIAFIHVLVITDQKKVTKEKKKQCEACKELIDLEATICPFCRTKQKQAVETVKAEREAVKDEKVKSDTKKMFIWIIVGIAALLYINWIWNGAGRKVNINQQPTPTISQSQETVPYSHLTNGTFEYVLIDPKYVNTQDLQTLGRELKNDYSSEGTIVRLSVYDDAKAVDVRNSVINGQATQADTDFYDAHYVAQYNKNDNTNYNEFIMYQDGSGQKIDKVIDY